MAQPASTAPDAREAASTEVPLEASALRDTMTRGASVMVLLTLAASVVNYASNLVFSRLLTTAEFGDLTAALAFAVIAAVPTAAAQTMIAERVARNLSLGHVEQMRWFIRHALGHVATVAVMVGVLYALALPLMISVLEIRAPGPAIALLPLIVLTFISPVALGVLQGMDRFIAFGLMTLAIAISRIAFGVPWAAAGGGSGGAVGGQAIGMLVVLLGVAWILREHILPRGTGAAMSGIRRRPSSAALSASAAFIACAVITTRDILLV
jgi:O-antigen/teichoic acid export membrane protein